MEFPPGLDVEFLVAAHRGDIRRLQELVAGNEKFPFADLTSPAGKNALHCAAIEGKTSVCRYLIEVLNFNIDATDEKGYTPLFHALFGKRRPTVIFLLDNGADVSHCNVNGETPLHIAADRGTVEMMKLLVSKGADVCATSDRGMPLHYAAKGNRDALEYILELTKDPHPDISALDLSPLFSAMYGHSIECVDLLLKAGADPNYKCYQVSPLCFAATDGDEGLIKCLLEAGADPNKPDLVGYTPLDHAALLGRREVVELLFPLTSQIACYPDWSINGIVQHAKSSKARAQLKSKQKEVALLRITKGKEAFKKKEYPNAYYWFSQATMADPLDAKVLSNLSFLSAKLYDAPTALREAQSCIELEPSWAKAHYREGVAYMLEKSFKKAAASFSRALALEPGNKEIEEAHRAALADADKFRHWRT